MRKGKDTIGKTVVTYDTGEKHGRIKDLIFDYHSNKVLGFLVHEGGWFKETRVVPVKAVKSIGPDSMIITSKNEVVKVDEVPDIQSIMEEHNILKHTKIMTTDGRDLGTMIDLYFDDQTWSIEGYEASGGIFADIYSGHSFVPAPQTLKIGEEYAFVEPEVAEKMKENIAGMETAIHAAGEKIQEISHTATEKLQETGEVVGQKFQKAQKVADTTLKAAVEKTTQKIQTTLPHPTVEQTKGRRVQQIVKTEEGIFIAASGQIVTDEIIAKAQRYHQEKALMDAVGLTTGEVIRSGAGEWLQKTGERIREGTQQAKRETQHLWEQTKERVSNIREEAVQAVEQKRIQGALGRRVNRTILDHEDNIIISKGDLITHEAIERARKAEILGILLDSVDSGKSESSEIQESHS